MSFLIQAISKNPRLPGILLFIYCIAALGSAFYVEYVMGIEPCVMCLYQRIPYAAVGLFSLFAIIAKPGGFTQQTALIGCGLAFLCGMGLAIYHMGIEEHWWISTCSSSLQTGLSLDDLKASLLAEPFKPCDRKDWVIFGQSITVYNTLFSFLMAIASFTFFVIIRKLKANTPSP
jgi:disulfide bond formation protein DsbB